MTIPDSHHVSLKLPLNLQLASKQKNSAGGEMVMVVPQQLAGS
jgi:hypothetical protein